MEDRNRLTIRRIREGISTPLVLGADFIPTYTTASGRRVWWRILENVSPTKFYLGELESVCFLKRKETGLNPDGVSIEEVRRRATKLGANMGLADAKRVYGNWGELSPKLWGRPLLFPGTVFVNPQCGDRYIIYLVRLPDRCLYNFVRIDGKGRWPSRSCLLRPARTKKRGG